jgi:hypothetical protein
MLSMRTCLPKPRRRQVESRWGLPQKPKLESLKSDKNIHRTRFVFYVFHLKNPVDPV